MTSILENEPQCPTCKDSDCVESVRHDNCTACGWAQFTPIENPARFQPSSEKKECEHYVTCEGCQSPIPLAQTMETHLARFHQPPHIDPPTPLRPLDEIQGVMKKYDALDPAIEAKIDTVVDYWNRHQWILAGEALREVFALARRSER